MTFPAELAMRTRLRATLEEPNISFPASWRERLTSVSVTLRAFFDVAKVAAIIAPAPMRKNTGVFADSKSDDIIKVSGFPEPELA